MDFLSRTNYLKHQRKTTHLTCAEACFHNHALQHHCACYGVWTLEYKRVLIDEHMRCSKGSWGYETFTFQRFVFSWHQTTPSKNRLFAFSSSLNQYPLPSSSHVKLGPSVASVMMMAARPSKALKAISLTLERKISTRCPGAPKQLWNPKSGARWCIASNPLICNASGFLHLYLCPTQ